MILYLNLLFVVMCLCLLYADARGVINNPYARIIALVSFLLSAFGYWVSAIRMYEACL